jgi:hypothetical protein
MPGGATDSIKMTIPYPMTNGLLQKLGTPPGQFHSMSTGLQLDKIIVAEMKQSNRKCKVQLAEEEVFYMEKPEQSNGGKK